MATTQKLQVIAGETLILEITGVAAPTPPPVDPPPVEPPPSGIEVPVGTFAAKLAASKDGDVLLLRGGTHPSPFLISKKKVTIQNWPGEVPVLTTPGRPDLLYLENDAVVRGITFKSQSTGFDDSQGAALSEVRSPNNAIGLVWYDGCTFIGTNKMQTREQMLYIAEKGGHVINEVRVTNCIFDGAGSKGYGIHPYSGPSPKLVTVTGSRFSNFPVNAAVTNWANACLINVDTSVFTNVITVARGQYSRINVAGCSGDIINPGSPFQGNVVGTNNTWT